MGSFPSPQAKPPKLKPAAPFSVYSNILPLYSISVIQSTHQLLSLSFPLCLRAYFILNKSAKKSKNFQSFLAFDGASGPGDVTSRFLSLRDCSFGQFALRIIG